MRFKVIVTSGPDDFRATLVPVVATAMVVVGLGTTDVDPGDTIVVDCVTNAAFVELLTKLLVTVGDIALVVTAALWPEDNEIVPPTIWDPPPVLLVGCCKTIFSVTVTVEAVGGVDNALVKFVFNDVAAEDGVDASTFVVAAALLSVTPVDVTTVAACCCCWGCCCTVRIPLEACICWNCCSVTLVGAILAWVGCKICVCCCCC